MVVGKPYIRFKVNNEPVQAEVDYNYTWATTVETNKGPVNTPVFISNAAQAYTIFNVDMRPYFAQNPKSLIMIRVAAKSKNKEPSKGTYSFISDKDMPVFFAAQAELKKTVTENGESVDYTHKLYYAAVEVSNGTTTSTEYIPLIEHRTSAGVLIPESYISAWTDNGRLSEANETAIKADEEKPIATQAIIDSIGQEDGITKAEYEATYRQGIKDTLIYSADKVQPLLIPHKYIIPAGTPLITLTGDYEGDYGVSISCSEALVGEGYTIVITEPTLGTLRIQNGFDLQKIANRINDKKYNVTATLTNEGQLITAAMHGYAKPIETYNVTVDGQAFSLITSHITENSFISLSKNKQSGAINYLTKADVDAIAADVKNQTNLATVEAIDYAISLAPAGQQSLVGGSNGEWDEKIGRIPVEYQADAHAEGLRLLQRVRLAGVFCMYSEDAIQRAYREHGINSSEPEKGMNNNETCKWRTILLGANENDRTDASSLAAKAAALNNSYVLLLGQGLIDSGFSGVASTMSASERKVLGLVNEHHLLPYECTQYIAGLRSKLDYGESIFGGQGRKRIRSIGNLDIAPLFDYDDSYEWDPNTYTSLNENGVLTFTEEYGSITLTDGVTTVQSGSEEDEEGVMNILKYTQNAIYDAVLPYIGRNINADLENSINMAVESVLSTMRDTDQTLIDTDEYSAYTVDISLGSRSNQLLGRIYIYLTITPVHALRQIEVEMTVQ